MSAVEEYRLTLSFRPRWRLLAKLAAALEEFELEEDAGPCEVLVGGDLHGGVTLLVRCPAPGPSAGLGADGEGGEVAPPAPDPGPGDGAATPRLHGVDGRRRRTPAPAPATTSDPGALTGRLVELLTVLHRDFDGVALDAHGRVASRIAETAGWSPKQASDVLRAAASIGLVRRRIVGKRCFEVAMTPVGLAAWDRLRIDVDDVAEDVTPEPGGGVADAAVPDPVRLDQAVSRERDELQQRRRAAAAAAI